MARRAPTTCGGLVDGLVSSDFSEQNSGWKICTTPPPPPPPRRRRHVIATITRAAAVDQPSRARGPGQACKCTYEGAWTCSGDNWPCSNPNSPLCATPDMSVASCILGGGDCGGYSGASDCDCAYSIAGAARSARPHPPTPHAIATTWALGHAMAKWCGAMTRQARSAPARTCPLRAASSAAATATAIDALIEVRA